MALPERRSAVQERRGPLGDVDQIAERMQRMLEETFGVAAPLLAEPAVWAPPVDIEERDDAYVIEAELPGAEQDDVDVELVGDELTISGEIKERERVGLLRRRTRRVGRFELRVVLPAAVDPEGIDASLDRGVLTVRVPKSERDRRRKISVSS